MPDFSPRQKTYIASSTEINIFLRACAGAGKTEVIAQKIANEMQSWELFPAGMAVLTFSRSATTELIQRISQFRKASRFEYPHFIGTIDGFLLKHIVTPLAHHITGFAGKDGDYSLRILDSEALTFQRTKYAIEHQRISANKYDWNASECRFVFEHPSDAIRRKLNSIELADWQIKDLRETKKRFLSAGYATYRDVEHLAIQILSDPKFSQRVALMVERFPFVMIDECQDLSKEQILIFERLAHLGVRFHLVGDLDQAIYGFRNCFPDAVAKFIARIGCLEMPLSENYRSGQMIVDLNRKLIAGPPIQGRTDFSSTTCYLVEYKNSPAEVLATFDSLARDHRISVIVARGHATLNRMRGEIATPASVQVLAQAIARFGMNAEGALYESLYMFSSYLARDCINCDTLGPEAFFRPIMIDSPERWHQFLAGCLTVFLSQGLDQQNVTWSRWCNALKTSLPALKSVECLDVDSKVTRDRLMEKKHSSPKDLKDALVSGCQKKLEMNVRRRYATIHEVKGETHDLTMLVSSSKQGEYSHWKEWINDPQSEAARLAYVASSRPRKILIWAVKDLDRAERKSLMNLGFQPYPSC
ncbi:UvrD-helicase domain-containing protein [Herbaspirillum rubrisubalbicans]|uniref:UvrD-helicase domain-containing protein n=1 Tax=Herbaspirillum rubrisubalbicans TaxID=80842 RepID=UPI0015EB5E4A|nr:ATP-dependent helicase [Herbaspirillum rubrisubalbicans]